MWGLFRSLIDRVKVLLAVRAVQELEAEALAAGEGRAAGLRRLAAGCVAEGLPEVAADLRHKADELDRDSAPPAPALAPSIPIVVAGFALAGLGVANAFPAAMTRVGLLSGPHGVAIASTLGYGGFLLGPPAIGFLAGAIGLGPALTTVSVLAVVAVIIAWSVTADARRENRPVTAEP